MIRADLHVHTYYSDGLLSPAEVVAEGINNGLDVIAITDHDCNLAYPEAAALCNDKGIKTVRGIEVSAYVGDVKIHTLGYNFDAENTDLKQFLNELYEGSLKRTDDIIRKLNSNGIGLTLDDVLKNRTCSRSPIHAMHIARAGAKKGYSNTPFNFFMQYLAYGKCAYSSIFRPSPERTVQIINASGGFTSLAHPARIDLSKDEVIQLIKKLKARGLGGIEGVYSTHTVTETAYYKELAKTFNLIVTGGSDTHFKGGKKQIGTPVFYADKALADKLSI